MTVLLLEGLAPSVFYTFTGDANVRDTTRSS